MTFHVYGHFYDHIYEPFKEERLYFSGFIKAVGATAAAYLHSIVTNMQVSLAFWGWFTVCFTVVKPRPGATAAERVLGSRPGQGSLTLCHTGSRAQKQKPWIIVQMSKRSCRGRSGSGVSSAVSRTRLTDPFPHRQPSGWISPGATVELEAAHYRSPAELFREAAEAAGTLSLPPSVCARFCVTANWWPSMPGTPSKHARAHPWVCGLSPSPGPVPGSAFSAPQNKEQLCSTGLVHKIEPRSSLRSPENSHCWDF